MTPSDSIGVALRVQNEMLNGFHDTLLQIVLWTLGAVILLVVGMLAVGWITNFRVYQRDREVLRSEIHSGITEGMAEVTERQRSALAEIQTSIKKEARSSVESALQEVRDTQQDFRYEMAKTQFEIARMRGDGSLVLEAAWILDAAVQGGWRWRIEEALELLIEALENRKHPSSPSLLTRIQDHLNKLSSSYDPLVKRVRELLG